ncbi:hypothetical protein VTI74DRAFT_7448 [Chaetomium olivicolor]
MDILHGDGVDAQTLSLIIQIQLEDLQEITVAHKPKGKGRAGERDVSDDLIAAVNAYRADLTATAQILADEAMCKSIAIAVETDADLIGTALSEEEQLTRDRELAFELSGQRWSAVARRQNKSHMGLMPTTTDEGTLESLRALNISSPSPIQNTSAGLFFPQADPGQAESSSWAQSRRRDQNVKPPSKSAHRTCVSCMERHPGFNLTQPLSCGHEYCRDCLRSLFTASLSDETLFPPKCCREAIPIDSCKAFLTRDVLRRYNAKKLEFDTPISNRTYCHVKGCSTFVPPAFIINDVAYCCRAGCSGQTCTVCKAASHPNSDCPEDLATQDMLRLAAAECWQRCYSCARFVELNTGCNHITCRCGAQFCYVCGAIWKTCGCAQWDERNLLDRANAIVDRDAEARPMAHRERENLVQWQAANLMQNHGCRHRSWKSRGGRHRCEECSDVLPNFIYECRQCHIMACRRCRFNRL